MNSSIALAETAAHDPAANDPRSQVCGLYRVHRRTGYSPTNVDGVD
jgi:hypothetical protein